MVQRDKVLLKRIENALLSTVDEVICTDIHKLCFNSSKQLLLVEACSKDSPFHYKIAPKEIKYSAVHKMLNGNWEDIEEGEIRDFK